VAIVTGAGDRAFSAGNDLKYQASGGKMSMPASGFAGLTSRFDLNKPVIAAVAGYAVAGGLELALWCDLRVAASNAVFGVFCRRFGVPLVDLGTIRLPRLIGHSHALDLILTGRGVSGEEALHMGLANRLVEHGHALTAALELARDLAKLPQTCLRSDRLSSYEQWSLSTPAAIHNEFHRGLRVIASGETVAGAQRFASGEGRHGSR
jgi:enoyl-CoA hydratase